MSLFDSYPIIDPRNERTLTEQAKIAGLNRSLGKLNDTTIHGAFDVFSGSMAFCGAEILYYANKLPLAFALKFLETSGAIQDDGSKATVDVTFTLSSIRPIPFYVPARTEILGYDTQGRTYSFFTQSELIIPAGATAGTITAEAESTGEGYNLPRGAIRQLTQPLAFIQSVSNAQASKGGSTPESDDDFIERAIQALRRRNLVSAIDFEEEAVKILGRNSYAKAIGLLNGSKTEYVPGVVHVFVLNKDGQPATTTQISQVYQTMQPRVQLGVTLFVSPMDQLFIDGYVIAKLAPGINPETMAKTLWSNYQYLMSPKYLKAGQSIVIDEIRFNLRAIKGIEQISRIELENNTLDIPMANSYTIAEANTLSVDLVTENNSTFSFVFSKYPDVD